MENNISNPERTSFRRVLCLAEHYFIGSTVIGMPGKEEFRKKPPQNKEEWAFYLTAISSSLRINPETIRGINEYRRQNPFKNTIFILSPEQIFIFDINGIGTLLELPLFDNSGVINNPVWVLKIEKNGGPFIPEEEILWSELADENGPFEVRERESGIYEVRARNYPY